ncbi:MAG: hypothetical protein FWC42_11460 [Proteobacteria bacterium]|nr:hypothetical protein [Pseudomonadota bacterium]
MARSTYKDKQREICARYGSPVVYPDECLKIGVAFQTKGKLPIRGDRLQPEKGTAGWYIWAGDDFSADLDFYQPVHIAHLHEIWPELIPYLALAPGYHFVIDDQGYEDIWYEPYAPNP